MSQPVDESEREHPAPFPSGALKRPLRGYPVAAWIVIVLLAGLKIGMNMLPGEGGDPQEGGTDVVLMTFQSHLMVGSSHLTRTILPQFVTSSGKKVYEASTALNTGSIAQRLRFVVLAGELGRPDDARRHLEQLQTLLDEAAARENPVEPLLEQAQVLEILDTLYADDVVERDEVNLAGLSDAQRRVLVQELGWFGELALVPRDQVPAAERKAVVGQSTRIFLVYLAVVIVMIGACLAGLVALVVFLIHALRRGTVKSAVTPSTIPHGIYAESFAVWFALFLMLQIPAGAVIALVPSTGLVPLIVAFFLSLSALIWPVMRGVPWTIFRHDVGLTLGRRPAVEPFIGALGYLMALPLVAIGFVLTLLLIRVQTEFAPGGDPLRASGPAHPILEQLADAGWWLRIQVLLVGAVAAPIVEEIVFRGVLHRHLRDSTRRWGEMVSILGSATISGFLFAVIHPQGWVAVPLLMGLAYGFVLVREWRGTLVPAMVLHGISNGLLLTAVMCLASAVD